MKIVLAVTLCLVAVALAASDQKQQSLLNTLNESAVESFLSSPDAVKEFVDCFERPPACPSKRIQGFIRDLPRSFRRGGRCVTCTPEQNAHLKKVLGKAITGLQQRHRREWGRLIIYVADYI